MWHPHRVLVGKPEGTVNFENLGIHGRLMLKLILKKQNLWTGFNWLRASRRL